MIELSTEEIIALLQELEEAEREAEKLYSKYLEDIKDEETKSILKKIRDEENGHAEIASEAISLLRHGSIYTRIGTLLGDFSETTTCLISTGIEGYMRANLAVLDYLITEKGLHCVYIAVNKPPASLEEIYRREGIDVDAISFLGCSLVGLDDADAFVVNPDNLTELSRAVTRLAQDYAGEGFVYFDTISSLTIFHPSNNVERFVYSLIPRLKAVPVGLVLVAVEDEVERRMRAVLTGFTDMKLEV